MSLAACSLRLSCFLASSTSWVAFATRCATGCKPKVAEFGSARRSASRSASRVRCASDLDAAAILRLRSPPPPPTSAAIGLGAGCVAALGLVTAAGRISTSTMGTSTEIAGSPVDRLAATLTVESSIAVPRMCAATPREFLRSADSRLQIAGRDACHPHDEPPRAAHCAPRCVFRPVISAATSLRPGRGHHALASCALVRHPASRNAMLTLWRADEQL